MPIVKCDYCGKDVYKYNSTLQPKNYCNRNCYFKARNTNEYIIKENYAELIINSIKYGKIILLIDIEDVEKCKTKVWSATYDKKMNDFYFLYNERYKNKVKKSISLHRFIMDCPSGSVVDHINTYNRLDNRKQNLRCTDQLINCRNVNQLKYKSGCSGVHWHKRDKIWEATITVNKKKKYLGRFENINNAIKVRKEAELKYWGMVNKLPLDT